MFRIPDCMDELEPHTREMILQYGRMYEDIEWTCITRSEDIQSPAWDPVIDGGLFAAGVAASEAAEWLAFAAYDLRKTSHKELREIDADPTLRMLLRDRRSRAIAKLECAYAIIGKQYVELARLGTLNPKHELTGPSAKNIQDLIDLSKSK